MINTYMRAVKCKNDHISFINSLETKLYDLAKLDKLCATEMSERDVHVAEELYQKNIFDKHSKGDQVFYTVHSKKEQL